jgi:hypothetical protein
MLRSWRYDHSLVKAMQQPLATEMFTLLSLYTHLQAIILSTIERARTVTHVANSGSLCTYSLSDDPELQGAPFGSHVDYVLDSNGWPVR